MPLNNPDKPLAGADRPIMSQAVPPLESGWKNPHRLRKTYGGMLSLWEERIFALRDRLVEDRITSGDSEETAKKYVAEHLAGWRRNRNAREATIAVSPEAESLLLSVLPKPLQPSWKTGGMMAVECGDSQKVWDLRLTKLRESLIADIAASGIMSQEEAELFIDDRFLAIQRQKKGQLNMAASPDAQRLALDERMLPKEKKPKWRKPAKHPNVPFMEPDWQTAVMMEKTKGGHHRRWVRFMEELRDELTQDLVDQAGMSLKDASDFVEDHLIGLRRTHGPVADAASPDAQRLLNERYVPARKKGAPAR